MHNKEKHKVDIILASASPRRREILSQAGIEFKVIVSDADENIGETDPGSVVEELARRKGRAVAEKLAQSDHETSGPEVEGDLPGTDYLVIGADTIVVHEGRILGKPFDREKAAAMLRLLSGKTHQVMTGVSMTRVSQGRVGESYVFHEITDVIMRELSDEEISDYVDTGDPLDKAGAYGIQGMAGMFVSAIHGDYYNVVGLPLCRTVVHLRERICNNSK